MPAEDMAEGRQAASLGMWVFLASEILMFGALFMALAVCRWLNVEAWRHASAHLHLWLGTANTAILLTSSLTMALAVGAARRDHEQAAMWLLGATTLLGLAFLGIKGTEYWLEYRDGLIPTPTFALSEPGARLVFQLYFLATGLHALHLALGCLSVGAMAVVTLRRGTEPVTTEMLSLYWHFVDVVWVFLFPVFYLAAPR